MKNNILIILILVMLLGCKRNEEEPTVIFGIISDVNTGLPIKNVKVELDIFENTIPGDVTVDSLITTNTGYYEFTEKRISTYSQDFPFVIKISHKDYHISRAHPEYNAINHINIQLYKK